MRWLTSSSSLPGWAGTKWSSSTSPAGATKTCSFSPTRSPIGSSTHSSGRRPSAMANRIDERLAALAAGRRKGLMTHVVIGYPSLASTSALIAAMDEAGADLIELQIPFSDPLADGPTIQSACEAAIARGARVRDAFTIAAESSARVQAPLLFMAYANTVYRYGTESF